jgi:hypothetical protein
MKHASSAFSQPQPSARRLVSIRRGSSVILKNSSSGEALQKREQDALLVVEEEDSSMQNSFDSPQSASLVAAEVCNQCSSAADSPASASDSGAQEETAPKSSGRKLCSPSLPDTSAGAAAQSGEDASDSSKPRKVTFSPPPSPSSRREAAVLTAPFDRSPFDSHSEPLHTPAPAAAVAGSASSALLSSQMAKILEMKSAIEQQYAGGKPQAYVPGSRRTSKFTPQDHVQGRTAPTAAASGRRQQLQQSETDKSGWLDKMKKNVVGFFEGGDSDISSSDDEHPQQDTEGAEIDKQLLQNIIAAVKTADPPLVCEHKKTSRFALGSSAHVLPLTFRGSELVDWLIDPAKAGKFVMNSRARAVAICQAMGSNNLIRNFEKDGTNTSFKDADLLYRSPAALLTYRHCAVIVELTLKFFFFFRFECDDKVLKDAEARAPATVSKFQKFRGNVSVSAAAPAVSAQGEKGMAVDALSADSVSTAISKIEIRNASKPTTDFSNTGAMPLASEDDSNFSTQLSTAHHSDTENFHSTHKHSSRIFSLDLRNIDPGTAPAAASSLKSVIDARISALEARTVHLQTQFDHMVTQIETKNREIGGIVLMLMHLILVPHT